jgi:hypothetical protein
MDRTSVLVGILYLIIYFIRRNVLIHSSGTEFVNWNLIMYMVGIWRQYKMRQGWGLEVQSTYGSALLLTESMRGSWSGYKLPGPGGLKEGPGPECVAHFLSFAVVSGVILRQLVVLAPLTFSGHLAYYVLCFASLTDGPPFLRGEGNKKMLLVPELPHGGPAYWAEFWSECSCQQKPT